MRLSREKKREDNSSAILVRFWFATNQASPFNRVHSIQAGLSGQFRGDVGSSKHFHVAFSKRVAFFWRPGTVYSKIVAHSSYLSPRLISASGGEFFLPTSKKGKASSQYLSRKENEMRGRKPKRTSCLKVLIGVSVHSILLLCFVAKPFIF